MYVENGTVYQICERCGADFSFAERSMCRREFNPDLCGDCKAKPMKLSTRNGLQCESWQGDYDLDDNPIRPDGSLFRPGPRLCGNRDCIRPTHIDAELEGSNGVRRYSKIEPLALALALPTGCGKF